MPVDFEIAELHRRLANLVRVGQVAAIDYAGAVPKVRVAIGALTTAWLPLVCMRAGVDTSWWPVDVDEQVLVLSPSGDLAQGVVVAGLNQTRFPAGGNSVDVHRCCYADGAVIEYDKASHCLQAILPAGATARLEADGGINIIGDVHVTGNITATQDISDGVRSMQADRIIFNRHTHAGIRAGGSNTAVPNEQQ